MKPTRRWMIWILEETAKPMAPLSWDRAARADRRRRRMTANG